MACCGLRLWTCAALATLPASLTAQEATQVGTELTFSFSQSLGVTRNPDLDPGNTRTSPLSTTELSLSYLTKTRTSRLNIDLSGGIRIDDVETQADAPTLSFGYDREAADADMSISGSIRRTEADSALSIADITAPDGTVVLPADVNVLNLDGTLTRAQIGGTLTWGKTAPLGYSLGASVVSQNYDGDAATVREDSVTTSLDGGVSLRISPVLQANVALRYAHFYIDDGTASTNQLSGSAGLSFDRPSGPISATLTAQDTGSGIRLGLQAARTFTQPDTSFTTGAGISRAPDGGTQAIGQLTYSHTLPRGQIELAASRSFVSANDDTDRRLTTVSASYAMPVTPLSSLQVGLDLAETRDDAGDTALSAALQVAQSFQLTPDWAISAGTKTELRQETGVRDARRDSLFVSLGRSLTWRP